MAALLSACGGKKVRVAKPAQPGKSETGIASWYGHPYHGRQAANGEIYDMEKFTAAHRTLPFETWVRVHNLSNDRTVDVRIQDRGPFIDGRVIDLSRAAAEEIDLIRPGITRVRVTVIAPPTDPLILARSRGVRPPRPATTVAKSSPRTVPLPGGPEVIARPEPNRPPLNEPSEPEPMAEDPPPASETPVEDLEIFGVQVGAFQDRVRAEALRTELEREFGSARIAVREGVRPVYRVIAGEEEDTSGASALAEQLRARFPGSFVVRIDSRTK
jgi:rare lipoprotein A